MILESLAPLDAALLPPGVRSRFVDGINGLRMHLLEAGHATPGRPVVLLLHGFPELAYSWRKLMPALAAAGFHAIAPDQRGYGRSTGWDERYDGDLASYRMLNLVRDALGLVMALGHREVAAVVGHDFGAPVAAWCALLRPAAAAVRHREPPGRAAGTGGARRAGRATGPKRCAAGPPPSWRGCRPTT